MMSSKILYYQAVQFLKFAGLLKAPEKLVREISEWAIGILAGKYLEKIYQEKENFKLNDYLENKVSSNSFKILSKYIYDGDFDSFIKEINKSDLIVTINNLRIFCNLTGNSIPRVYNIMLIIDDEDYSDVILYEDELKELFKIHRNKIKEKVEETKETVKNNETLKEINEKIIFISKYIKKNITKENNYSAKVIFHPEDLPYQIKSKFIKSFYFDVSLIFGGAQERKGIYAEESWRGIWSGADIYLDEKIYCGQMYLATNHITNTSIESFQSAASQLQTTIHHETLHMIQLLYNAIKGAKYFGKPNQELQGKFQSKNELKENEKDIPHEFRRSEFYTRLQDAVTTFLVIMNKYKTPKYLWNYLLRSYFWELPKNHYENMRKEILKRSPHLSQEEAKLFIFDTIYPITKDINFESQRTFLKNLKNNQPLKWQKAVKEITKAIEAEISK